MKNLFIPCRSNGYKPVLLRKSALVVYTVILLLVNTFGGLVGIPKAMASSITSANIIQLTNQERSALGLNSLNSNAKLAAAAQAKANNMFEEQYWDHFGPNGESPWMFITQAGYEYIYAGENLAKGFRTAEGVHEAWMASASHKENIVSPNYKDIGVAVVEGVLLGKETLLVVQMFGNLTSDVSKSQVAPEETSVPVSTPTTKPVAPSESGQIKSIKISSPKSGDVTNDANVNVKGETINISGEYVVEIVEGFDSVANTKSNESSWEVDKGSDWEEGDHSVYAQIKGSDTKSDVVTFTVDSTPPTIDEQSISVEHLEDLFKLAFVISDDSEELKIVSGDKTFPVEKNEEGNLEVTLYRSDIGDRTVLMASDSVGNISEVDISEYFLEGDSGNVTSNVILWFRNVVGTTDGISMLVVSFVFLLLAIEVYVYWKKGSLGKHSGELFTLAAWVTVLLVAAFKGFGGIIN